MRVTANNFLCQASVICPCGTPSAPQQHIVKALLSPPPPPPFKSHNFRTTPVTLPPKYVTPGEALWATCDKFRYDTVLCLLAPFTTTSDHFQISPAASPEIHHIVWRTWLFIACLGARWYTVLPILTTSLIHFSLKGWENVLFNLGVKGLIQDFEYGIAPLIQHTSVAYKQLTIAPTFLLWIH